MANAQTPTGGRRSARRSNRFSPLSWLHLKGGKKRKSARSSAKRSARKKARHSPKKYSWL